MTTSVQVKLELGHRATLREHITDDGFTHDWTVFVRGPDACNIHHFVEKIIFNLHRDFAKPKRVIKEPPYEVSESGYGSFIIPIEVYFKQKEEPKKVQFEYDLFLNIQNPVNHIRCEKLTFQNPTDEFRRKLMRAGAVGIVHPDNNAISLNPHHYQRPSTPNFISGTLASQNKDRKATSLAIKAPKSSSSSAGSNSTQLKESAAASNEKISKSVDSAKSSSTVSANKSFVDLFGQPINKTSKSSPDPQKNSHPKKSSSSHESKSSSNSSLKESKSSGVVKDINKSQVKEKIFSKRPLSPLPTSPQYGQSATKKRKRSSTSSPSSSHGSFKSKEGKEIDKVADKKSSSGVKVKSEKKEKSSSKEKSNSSSSSGGGGGSGSRVVESASNNSSSSKTDVKSGKEVVSKPVKKLKQDRPVASSTSPSLSTNSSIGSNSELTRSRGTPQFTPPKARTNYDTEFGGGDESRSSTSSFSSVHQYKGSGPLGALMAELDDEQDDVLSPLSSDGSSPQTSNIKQENPQPTTTPHISSSDIKSKQSHDNNKSNSNKIKNKEEKSKESKGKKIVSSGNLSTQEHHNSGDKKASKKSSSGKVDANSEFHSAVKPSKPLQFEINEEYILELQDLQRRIMLLKDRQHLQQIVNVIEETGQYQVTSTTFDFDLCRLDKGTVKKLQSCLAVI